MTNIIQFPDPEVVDVKYLISSDGVVEGLTVTGSPINICSSGVGVTLYAGSHMYAFNDRESAAKLFWAAAYYLDSEQRYAEDTYVGLNYEK